MRRNLIADLKAAVRAGNPELVRACEGLVVAECRRHPDQRAATHAAMMIWWDNSKRDDLRALLAYADGYDPTKRDLSAVAAFLVKLGMTHAQAVARTRDVTGYESARKADYKAAQRTRGSSRKSAAA